jgi:hypothetical protein
MQGMKEDMLILPKCEELKQEEMNHGPKEEAMIWSKDDQPKWGGQK